MSLYQKLSLNPPKLQVKDGAREVQIFLVSCMCDNKKKLTLKKKEDGDFKLYTNGQHPNNFQFKGDIATDCEWKADEGNWPAVWKFINSGVQVVERVISR